MKPFLTLLVILSLSFLAPAASGQRHKPEDGVFLAVPKVYVKFQQPCGNSVVSYSDKEGTPTNEITCDNVSVKMVGEQLVVNGKPHGSVKKNDKVVYNQGKVFVNGERR